MKDESQEQLLNEYTAITPFLRYFTLLETLVLVAIGFGLFLNPEVTRPMWAWSIAPFNTRFLGAIYLSAMVPVGIMFISGRWSPTRPVLSAIFTFTFIVLVVSLFHSDQFDFQYWGVWVWFILYLGLPTSGAYHLWLYRSMPTNHLNRVPSHWFIILRITSLALVIYGIGLIISPELFSSLFPWKLDIFHSQLYSATFITGSVMLFTVSRKATRAEFITTGLTEATFGIFSIVGTMVVDISVKKINWSALNTQAWLVMLVVIALLGISMTISGFRQSPGSIDNQ
ncbi:MAG: hypothetical protein HOM14_05315 [Gammaproteobacteria bacterium]|jgi:hypothetical protein|nr:hypothetical protein [Gammaproteobacteria bacterium]MBT3723597.1 hypothetical protein [Gammaproteobacteria bacterium]MBT4194022.1 hypothetical protein [Gammaproteobacteria bacterium]MBT4449985.1 hypothetical protein [Gammaproteobacteria bacterium]MBT4859574.1 hypothetical protein [Gammaproteobacteria bacterium]